MTDTYRFNPDLFPVPVDDPDRMIVNVAMEVYRPAVGRFNPRYWMKKLVTHVEFVELTQVEFVYSTGEVKPGRLDECQFRSALRYLLAGELRA